MKHLGLAALRKVTSDIKMMTAIAKSHFVVEFGNIVFEFVKYVVVSPNAQHSVK